MDGESLKFHLAFCSLSIDSSVMLMLYELEVLQSDSDRIGEPVALPLTDIINSGATSNRLGLKTKTFSFSKTNENFCSLF